MKLILKFVIPLIVALGIIGALMVPTVDLVTQRWVIKDLERRSQLVTSTLQESLQTLLVSKSRERKTRIQAILDKVAQDERILAMGYCNAKNELEFKTVLFPTELNCQHLGADDQAHELITRNMKGGSFNITTDTLLNQTEEEEAKGESAKEPMVLGRLVMVHDLSLIHI